MKRSGLERIVFDAMKTSINLDLVCEAVIQSKEHSGS